MHTLNSILNRFEFLKNQKNIAGMAHFGIQTKKVYGISAPILKKMAREIGHSHVLAQQLWKSGSLEARTLAALIDEPTKVTEGQMERWVREFDNWAVCDNTCGSLFDKTPFAWKKAVAWSRRKEEFVKRAGYALMAWLAVHDRKATDGQFVKLLPHIKQGATDERNFVKKAVNWALRQIGKRNINLNKQAIRAAKEIHRLDSPAAKWVASDALRELTGKAVKRRLLARAAG
jgi:3-methyladenine DNA glycosylase AlkD